MKKLLYGLMVILMAGCKEKYIPEFTAPDTGYLVVEGVINSGGDSTHIELSRTTKISAPQRQYESGAVLQVEGNDNSAFAMRETGNGRYSALFNLSAATQYRLRIKTAAGKEYLSDFAEVKITPPVDSISWQRENGGVQLYINAHDAQNKTQYYQWDYKETWEFHSASISVLKFTTEPGPYGPIASIGYKDSTFFRPDTSIYKCWRSFQSDQLVIGSSAKLTEDRIYKPLLFIPRGDRKISVRYSIYLRQYALTKPAYEFLEKMKRNTEENGSIFDPQPSQLNGNIHCVTDPDEPVIGYVNISTITEKRIFISKDDVPGWNFISECEEISVRNDPDSVSTAWGSGLLPTRVLVMFGNFIVYFGATTPACVDCTLSGTNVKPSFWP